MKFLFLIFIALLCTLALWPDLLINGQGNLRRLTAPSEVQKQVYIVEFYDPVSNQSRLIKVKSTDKINAVIEAIYPATVWTEKEWNEAKTGTIPFDKAKGLVLGYNTTSNVMLPSGQYTDEEMKKGREWLDQAKKNSERKN